MKPAYVGHPVAIALFFCTLGAWTVIEIRQALNRRAEATNMDRGSLVIERLCSAAGVVLAALALR